jgi:hypothetical protein
MRQISLKNTKDFFPKRLNPPFKGILWIFNVFAAQWWDLKLLL